MTHFAHRRITNPDGTFNARGGVTIAYEQVGNYTNYAIARCHNKDNFVKAEGRVKAAGRLQSLHQRQVSLRPFDEFKSMVHTVPITEIGNL